MASATAGPSISTNTYDKSYRNLNIKAPILTSYRCDKCIHEPWYCGMSDEGGACKLYKRDPPDGGFYG